MKEWATHDTCYDIAVIGSGVIGAAVARQLTLAGAHVAILEKALDPLDGASKGNSAILHTGFDAPVGSLEQKCVARGRALYLEQRGQLGLPIHETGALVLAWSQEEEAKLDDLLAQAHENGVSDAKRLSRSEILAREPNLSSDLVGGFLVPGEHIIDPWTTPHAYLAQALAHGATYLHACEVQSGEHDGDVWRLTTSRGALRAKAVLNCAGLYGDIVEERLLGTANLAIKPRKGQFVVFDKAASGLVRSIILPVPTERTKGVVVCRTIFGNVLVGPTAEEQESRTDASVDHDTLIGLKDKAAQLVPAIADCEVTAVYAGIRPASDRKEYRIIERPDKAYLNLGGIRSTGLSAALGLAEYVLEAHSGCLQATSFSGKAVTAPARIAMQHLSDHHSRDWQRAGNGGIVCHCEKVTRRDIETAFDAPMPPRSFAGLKRRTRVCMGRCQGFYCMAAVAALTRGKLDEPMVVDTKDVA